MSDEILKKRKKRKQNRVLEGEAKLRWRDSVERALEGAGVNSQQWERMAGDRDRCRRLVQKAEQTK